MVLVGNSTEAVKSACAGWGCSGPCLEAAEVAKPLYRLQGLSRGEGATGEGRGV